MRNKMKYVHYKLKFQDGMSLTETLMAVLIMSLVTLAIAAGVTAGSRVYRRITLRAEEQTLLATTVDAVSDYFEKADGEIKWIDSDTVDISYSEVTKSHIQIFNNNKDGIYIRYMDKNEEGNIPESTPLVSKKSNTSNLYAKISPSTTSKSDVTAFKITIFHDNDETVENMEIKVKNTTRTPKVPAE